MKITVTTYHYTFNPPSQITKTEYEYYKELIRSDPRAKLNDKLRENPIKKGLRIALQVGLTPFYLFNPYQAEADIKSAFSKARAKKAEDRFYEELKRMVIESTSFNEFCVKVKRKFPFYQ